MRITKTATWNVVPFTLLLPTLLLATPLKWDDNSDNEDGFEIVEVVDGEVGEVIVELDKDQTRAEIPPEKIGGKSIAIRAYNETGLSELSNILDVEPLPNAPTNFTITININISTDASD